MQVNFFKKKTTDMSVLDFIQAAGKVKVLTKEEFREIRNSGDEDALLEALEAMEAAGGYDALEDD